MNTPPPPAEPKATSIEPEEWRPYQSSWTEKFAIAAFALMLLVSLVIFAYKRTRLPFDATQWKSAAARGALNQRERMCRELLDSKRLMGLNQTQVVALLGQPDEKDVNGWELGYFVGNTLTGTPSHFLINLDDSGKVVGEAIEGIKPYQPL